MRARTLVVVLSGLLTAANAVAIEPGDVRIITPRPVSAENQGDIDAVITAQIRATISSDQSLSNNGHNVSISTDRGIVMLKGPVDSEDEKAAIEAKARGVDGVKEVTSQLEVVSR